MLGILVGGIWGEFVITLMFEQQPRVIFCLFFVLPDATHMHPVEDLMT